VDAFFEILHSSLAMMIICCRGQMYCCNVNHYMEQEILFLYFVKIWQCGKSFKEQ
jgi:hypothetical protein